MYPQGQVKGMEDTQEWHEDPIPGMGVQDDDLDSSESESESDSDSEYGKPGRYTGSIQTNVHQPLVRYSNPEDRIFMPPH